MSRAASPSNAVAKAVTAPTSSTALSAVSLPSNSGDRRATMKMPAVTMVAAWIIAEIGVGPSIESGSHTCSGTCADLPMAPRNSSRQASVSRSTPGNGEGAAASASARANTAAYSRLPAPASSAAMPSRKPKSPRRLTRKALRLAAWAEPRVYQKPISR